MDSNLMPPVRDVELVPEPVPPIRVSRRGPHAQRFLWIAVAVFLTACSAGATATKTARVQTGMSADQVQAILGRPTSIEQAESTDQTVSGEVQHFSSSRGEARVVLVNHRVFAATFTPGSNP